MSDFYSGIANLSNLTLETVFQVSEMLPIGVLIVNETGQIIHANSKFCNYLGSSASEICRLKFADITHPDDRNRDLGGFESLLAGEISAYSTEKRYVRKDGAIIWVNLTSTSLHSLTTPGRYALTVVQDISHRKQTEISLSESEIRFRTLFEQAPFSIQLLGLDGRTLQVNQAWKDLWQAPPGFVENFILKNYNILDDPELEAKGILPYIKKAYQGESVAIPPILYEATGQLQELKTSWVSAFAHPIRNSIGELREIVLIHQDVSERMQAEKKLKEAKLAAESANQMKSSFLANMSHEIRTPLGAIMGFTELLHKSDLSDSEREEYLSIIKKSGVSLNQIIDDVLDLSRVEAGNLKIAKQQVDLGEALDEVHRLFEIELKKRELRFHIKMDTEMPSKLWTDPHRIKQILVNLIGNAIKFTHEGHVSVHISKLNDFVLAIDVQDTGIGIDPDRADQLFKPFSQLDHSSTRRYGGTGLGLALSRRLSQLLDGDIVLLESANSKGSTFRFTIPIHVHSQKPDESQIQSEVALTQKSGLHSSTKKLKILVVDDSSDNRLLMKALLKDSGVLITLAENGQEAVQMAMQDNYELILMDIQMPVMDGLEATRRLRKCGFKNPIIAVTAHAMPEEVQLCLEAGCTDHLSKPIPATRLKTIIQNLV